MLKCKDIYKVLMYLEESNIIYVMRAGYIEVVIDGESIFIH